MGADIFQAGLLAIESRGATYHLPPLAEIVRPEAFPGGGPTIDDAAPSAEGFLRASFPHLENIDLIKLRSDWFNSPGMTFKPLHSAFERLKPGPKKRQRVDVGDDEAGGAMDPGARPGRRVRRAGQG
jgi:hypothetical protein